ncbi:PucR family transcriptional regulator [Nocardioides donggukensis]|uniref:Helix-turn-helix domain-containing protein n=1 Tax=Nocardioides donggukensis TaxID=2774019 RepID=A0A927Q156_9ACTN|nr:helix-turn-helix domain-containing protein [Nocardioides donggukensis]MBD8868426.1 helix-turn-helix domain-containing protein [Nocardioides donggukensis]
MTTGEVVMVQDVLSLHDDARGVEVLADWVRGRADAVAHDATEAIWAEVDAYGDRADQTLKPEVAAHCRQVFLAFLASVDGRRNPGRADFPWTSRHAMRRVDLGIALPDFMKAFRIGQITLWDDILEGVRENPGAKDAALLLVNQVMRTIEVGSTAAAEAYLEAQQFKIADSARLARDLLEDLLAGRPPTVRPRVVALAEVGLAEDRPLFVAVGRVPAPDEAPAGRRDLFRLRTALASPGRGLAVVRQDEVVAVLPVSPGSEGRVLEGLRSAVTSLSGQGVFAEVGVSTARAGLHDVPEAYDEARMAGRALSAPGVRSLAEMSTLDFLVASHGTEAQRMVRPEVRAFVLEDLAGDGMFVETLSQYVAHDLNAKLAAMKLHVHANTVYYRLERIAERTGCDVRRVDELIDLLLAVRLVRSERH